MSPAKENSKPIDSETHKDKPEDIVKLKTDENTIPPPKPPKPLPNEMTKEGMIMVSLTAEEEGEEAEEE